ncbi:hypothetical protein CkaCkLH20_11699 [Colletotrichum karsti]|uniref:Uncharacterized protein n=1 Tax=Colletotrichum karsti TaxID=1095194 RepID=A0A9P6HVD0_9PEZI|nr:uncharacterized protein CkaCkLH20_11699 [Colletotrichum karsti]KAF9870800.1 hypothetical protein CkaCkLH20_11699 [Colletotrichum karsti]
MAHPRRPPPPPPPPPNAKLGRNIVNTPTLRSSSRPSLSSHSWRLSSVDSATSSDEAEDFYDQDTESDDPFDHQNRASFPPLMPTVQSRTAVDQNRKKITRVITNQVSRLKNGRSPVPGSESDASSVHSTATSVDLVQSLWVRMKEQRQQVNDIKQDMAGRRRHLRELRRRKDAADNAFMNMVRPILIRGQQRTLDTLDAVLDKKFADMQSIRTEYYSRESYYEGLEINLDKKEEDLNNIETRFFSALAAGTTGAAQEFEKEISDDDEPKYLSDIPHDLMGISRNGPTEEAHPLWEDLVCATGDFTNAQDDYDELVLINEQYAYGMGVKKAAGKTLSPEEEHFINDFPDQERERRREIDRLAEEVKRLKRVCEENGAMKKHPSYMIAYALDPDIGEDMTLDDSWPSSKSLAHHRFPDLLSCPDHLLQARPLTALDDLRRVVRLSSNHPAKKSQLQAAQKELAISRLMIEFKGDDKSDFVTRWLLHQLRTSPMSVELLHATFIHEARLRISNLHRWQQDVLFYWWRDGAVKRREDFLRSTSASGVPQPATHLVTAVMNRSPYMEGGEGQLS